MTQAITQIANYDALWQSLRTRRRTLARQRGLDAAAGRWWMRLRHVRRGLGKWQHVAQRVDALDSAIQILGDTQLDDRVAALREVFRRRHTTESHVIDGLAVLRELAWRTLGLKPYVVQLAGALAIHHGQIVQMATGEGKTLAATMAGTLLAWSKPSVHIVTANAYLAKRDARDMGRLYTRAGVTTGCVVPDDTRASRIAEYRKSVVYTTQKELVADWLRDQLKLDKGRDVTAERLAMVPSTISGRRRTEVLIPGLHAAIIDEADSVLIDQAATPLIITSDRGPSQTTDSYHRAAELAEALSRGRDYEIQQTWRRVKLTEEGKQRLAQTLTEGDRGTWRVVRRRHELVEQALGAVYCYQRGVHYELVDGRVTLIDEFTGRFLPDRQWQHGIHQAVETKEGLAATTRGDTAASLSFQRFFRFYPFLAGMTGTAVGARREFEQTYRIPVRVVPTNRPMCRKRFPLKVLKTSDQRWDAVVESVKQLHEQGRPVLIGTRSVEASQHLSDLFRAQGLSHQVLNAVNYEQEAQIVSQAGQLGAVTVATNMAGRGTDIKLGPGVAAIGGLHVILTERHEAGRIDEQLIGRAGRQGDPGSSQILCSLEDQLLANHCASLLRWVKLVCAGRVRSGCSRAATALFTVAQNRAERRASAARRAVLRRDDWLDQAVPSVL